MQVVSDCEYYAFTQVVIVHYSTGLSSSFRSSSFTTDSRRSPLLFPPLCFAQGRDAFYML